MVVLLLLSPLTGQAEDLGNLSVNPYAPDSLTNPFGAGSPYKPDGLLNPYSRYGSEYSNQSWSNPYATDAPRLYDQDGEYRGRLSVNPYDPDSTSTPDGRYGSPYSPDSLNKPDGAVRPDGSDRPLNPGGEGWDVEGSDDFLCYGLGD